MSIQTQVKLNTGKILSSYGLGASGSARKYLARRVRARSDKYVPKDTGLLKNTAVVSPDGGTITYVQPYAKKQFYVNYRHADPNRGPQWHRRMLAAEQGALAAELQRFMKRRPG